MSDILNLEEKADLYLKKLSSLLNNLSSNLSKEKTEYALEEGYGYILEIENILNKLEKTKNENNSHLYIIKGDYIKNKEKFENLQKTYILNKSNQLIDSLSTNNLIDDENILDYDGNNNGYDEKKKNNSLVDEDEDEDETHTYEKNFIDEYFKENNNLLELKDIYLYNDNFIFQIKRILYKFCLKAYNKSKEISQKSKYLILLFLLIILLIFCIFNLYSSINDYAR